MKSCLLFEYARVIDGCNFAHTFTLIKFCAYLHMNKLVSKELFPNLRNGMILDLMC